MKLSHRNNSNSKGFTLIELLIVIVIIGILSGVLLTVINPARQQRKSNETVLRTTTEKYCLALMACAATASVSTSCDDLTELGVYDADGEPTGATYVVADEGGDVISVTGTLDTCAFYCAYDFTRAEANPVTPFDFATGTACIVE